jgi:mannose-6-phosphate isomerase-like protein (cupin superfamily)
MTTTAVNLAEAKELLQQLWSPKIIGSVNDQYVKIAKARGVFPWHTHEHEDELFLVISGRLSIHRSPEDGGTLTLGPGELYVVPRGMRHSTSADDETYILLVEPKTTAHAGTTETPLARSIAEQLA